MTAERGALYGALPKAVARVLGPPLRTLGPGNPGFIARFAGTHTDTMLARSDGHWEGLVERYGLAGAGDVLDVGCGAGAWLPALARCNRRVVAVDPDERSVAVARARSEEFPNVQVMTMAAEKLELESGSFDAIACMTVLPYLAQPAAVREMNRVLRYGGRLVVGTVGGGYYAKHVVQGARERRADIVSYGLDPIIVSHARTLARREVAPGSLRSWSPRALRTLLDDNGFDPRRVELDSAAAEPAWPARYLGCPVYFVVTAIKRPGGR
jgi:SAM-dependent methyltransferase